jgi:hypothetical protein
MKFLDLPNDILLKILSNLNQKELLNVTLVSKNVNKLALDPVLWTTLTLNYENAQGRRVNLEIYEVLFFRCTNLRDLDIVSTDNILIIDHAVRNCKLLSRLKMKLFIPPDADHEDSEDYFSLPLFTTLDEHGHNIRELEIEGSVFDWFQFNRMRTVLGRLTLLTLDNRFWLEEDEDNLMPTVGNFCSNLRHLNLEFYRSRGRRFTNFTKFPINNLFLLAPLSGINPLGRIFLITLK